jgi:hypothetical protein
LTLALPALLAWRLRSNEVLFDLDEVFRAASAGMQRAARIGSTRKNLDMTVECADGGIVLT